VKTLSLDARHGRGSTLDTLNAGALGPRLEGRSPGARQPARSPSAPALRMRRHRERRQKAMRCMTIELRETVVTALIRKGFLKEEVRNDLRAVKSAFYGFLDRTLDG
jgi:hypothetical protein